ncbi:MAG: hypothetical protein HXY34_03935 [Candidatus Thorarchaeota archaeon]|nr:hypothetical protein [Candidatus Thorarchaeota archaeon]
MIGKSIYNRRLRPEEHELWTVLPRNVAGVDDGSYLRDLSAHPGAILYLSTLEEQVVGGTALFRDEAAKRVGILAIRLRPDSADKVARHILKSSLPYFPSQHIRSVDVVVSERPDMVDFPPGLSVPSWLKDSLLGLDFSVCSQLYRHRFSTRSLDPSEVSSYDVVRVTPSAQDARLLLLQERTRLGLDFTQSLAALELGCLRNQLSAVSKGGQLSGLCCTDQVGDTTMCTLAVVRSDPEAIELLARLLTGQSLASRSTAIELLQCGSGQDSLIDSLSQKCGRPVETTRLLLMKKTL